MKGSVLDLLTLAGKNGVSRGESLSQEPTPSRRARLRGRPVPTAARFQLSSASALTFPSSPILRRQSKSFIGQMRASIFRSATPISPLGASAPWKLLFSLAAPGRSKGNAEHFHAACRGGRERLQARPRRPIATSALGLSQRARRFKLATLKASLGRGPPTRDAGTRQESLEKPATTAATSPAPD